MFRTKLNPSLFPLVLALLAAASLILLGRLFPAAAESNAGPLEITLAPANQMLEVGGTANFSVTVSATTNVDAIRIRSQQAPNCNRDATGLTPGSFVRYTCSVGPLAQDLAVRISAAGTSDGAAVAAQAAALADVVIPAIGLSVLPDKPVIIAGSDLTFTIRMTNTGNYNLNYIGLSSSQAPVCELAELKERALQPGKALSAYRCRMDDVQADAAVIFKAVGSPPIGVQVAATQTVLVDVIRPAIFVNKQWLNGPGPIQRDTPLQYRFELGNIGDVLLTDVVMRDTLLGCDYGTESSAALAPNGAIGFNCTAENPRRDVVATATITGIAPNGVAVTDSASVAVEVIAPELGLALQPAAAVVDDGATVPLTLTVLNPGDAPISGIMVVGQPAGCAVAQPFALNAGSQKTFTCSTGPLDAPMQLRAVFTATGAAGSPFAGEKVQVTASSSLRAVEFAAVTGRAWIDTDGDGLRGTGEPGLPGVEVRALNETGSPLAFTRTDGGGAYVFDRLVSGRYRFAFSAPEDHAYTVPDATDNAQDGRDSDANMEGVTAELLLPPNGRAEHVDAGFYVPTALGGVVWYDANLDGELEPGEPRRASISVTLYSGVVPLGATTTNGDGLYHFEGLAPGAYRAGVGLPARHLFSPQASGGSVVDASGLTPLYMLKSGKFVDGADAGIYGLAAVGGLLLQGGTVDQGLFSGGEPVAGATVRLYANPGSSARLEAATGADEQGRYGFPGLAAGRYAVEVPLDEDSALLHLERLAGGGLRVQCLRSGGQSLGFTVSEDTNLRDMDWAVVEAARPGDPVIAFIALPYANSVELTWVAAPDPGEHSYRVWRAETPQRVSAQLIYSQTIQPEVQGRKMHPTVVDSQAEVDVDYWYWLERVPAVGARREWGPVHAGPQTGLDRSLYLHFLPLVH